MLESNMKKGYLFLLPLSFVLSIILAGGTSAVNIPDSQLLVPESKFKLDSIRSKNTSTLRRIEQKCKEYELIQRKDSQYKK